MKREYDGDVRPTSYDEDSAITHGQSEFDIKFEASLERFAEERGYARKKPHSDRWWLLQFLGLDPNDARNYGKAS